MGLILDKLTKKKDSPPVIPEKQKIYLKKITHAICKMTKLIKKKLNDFWYSNTTARKIRAFFNLTFFPYFRQFLLYTIIAFIVIFAYFKIFHPHYIEKATHKFQTFFFHYLHLDNYNFHPIKIEGNNRVKTEEIIALVEKTQKANALQNDTNDFLIHKLAKEIKNNFPWINQINITRTLPNKLNITVTEYEPFAIWQNSGQKYVIDKDGNKVKIDDDEEFKNLIILSGRDANLHVKTLFNIFVINPELSTKIYSATWIGERRWDIRFENGLLVKLPPNDIQTAWYKLIKIYNTPGSLTNLTAIDLRVTDKTYLQYNDDAIKEIRNFKL